MRIVVFAVIESDVSVVIESVVFVVIESVASESVVFIVSESVTSESVARGGFAGGQESTPAVGRDSPEKQQVVASNQNVFLSNTKMYLSQITNCISFKSQNVFVSIFLLEKRNRHLHWRAILQRSNKLSPHRSTS